MTSNFETWCTDHCHLPSAIQLIPVIQESYHLKHVIAEHQAWPHAKSYESNEECCSGYYQNLGRRSINQTSGSAVTPPPTTSNHHNTMNDLKSLPQISLL